MSEDPNQKREKMPGPLEHQNNSMTWAERLGTHLEESQASYDVAKDEERREISIRTLFILLGKLDEVPEIKRLGPLTVVGDILDFLDDIERGRDHSWRSLGPFGGLQKYTIFEQRTRARTLLGLEILIDATAPKRGAKKAAFQRLASMLASFGQELSADRVKGLYYEYKRGKFPHPEFVQYMFEGFWKGQDAANEVARCMHGDPVYRCLASGGGRCRHVAEVAEAYIEALFAGLRKV